MALLTSGVLKAVSAGCKSDFFEHWWNAFMHAWPIGFLTIFIIVPLARKIVGALVASLCVYQNPLSFFKTIDRKTINRRQFPILEFYA
jgi:hypothetical protein